MWKEENRQAFARCVADLLGDEAVLSLKALRHHMGLDCYEHSVYVAYISFLLSRRLGLDYHSAARGGLLHDLFLYDWRIKGSHQGLHGLSHPKAALKNASARFPLNARERDIIVKHMWPLTLALPRYRESFVVCMADKFCAVIEMCRLYQLLHIQRRLTEPLRPRRLAGD